MVVYSLEEGKITTQENPYNPGLGVWIFQRNYWHRVPAAVLGYGEQVMCKKRKVCTHLAHPGSSQKGLNLKSRDENLNLSPPLLQVELYRQAR